MGDKWGICKLPTRHGNKSETPSESNSHSDPLIVITGKSVKSIQISMLDMWSRSISRTGKYRQHKRPGWHSVDIAGLW